MGFYKDRVLPIIIDKAMTNKVTRETRARVCEPLAGEVVELGFGTGHNVPYYPLALTRVLAIEPSAKSMRIAEKKIAASPTVVELAGLDGQRLDLPSESVDTVLSTWTLCTIPDPEAALAEVHRVLKPGGVFHFVEHGHSPDAKVARHQRRMEPLNKRLLGGCHVTRDIAGAIKRAGFEIEDLDTHYAKGEPKYIGFTYEGRAVKR